MFLTVFASSPMLRRTNDSKKRRKLDNSLIGSTCHPIDIHFLPPGSSQLLVPTLSANDATLANASSVEPILVHGLLDVAIEEYTDWQLARVSNEAFRDNIIEAHDVTLDNRLDLTEVYEDQDPKNL
ncbi:hypothetical protein N7495_002104 [Penicillium taxi]|uniref:uncharacterized protein n=1 Tax=Penicillium taxi TaxID=168475 RepID=UPI002544E0E5|nr:uncharacterized protein N7495_002104 [Penicillium taxi]KAJ5901576.1 hypothetical protein N7495_002104 [Penicillium taxi]